MAINIVRPSDRFNFFAMIITNKSWVSKKDAIPYRNRLFLSISSTSPANEKNKAIRYKTFFDFEAYIKQAIKAGMIMGLLMVCQSVFSQRIAMTFVIDATRNINRKNHCKRPLFIIIQNSGNKHCSVSFKSNGFIPVFKDSLIIFESSS